MRHFILVQRFHRYHESCDEVMNESPVPRKGTSNHAVPAASVADQQNMLNAKCKQKQETGKGHQKKSIGLY
jgi:hypothetical protein